MIDADLRDLFGQTVTIAPWRRQNANGEGVFGDPVPWPVQISGVNKMVRNLSGQEVVASLKLVLFGAPIVSPKDRVTLPSGYLLLSPPILSVQVTSDENGPHHTELMLQ